MIDDPDADILYLVMELMEGGSIQGSDLEEGPLGEFLSHSYFMYVLNLFLSLSLLSGFFQIRALCLTLLIHSISFFLSFWTLDSISEIL